MRRPTDGAGADGRRSFLKYAGISGATALLAGCKPRAEGDPGPWPGSEPEPTDTGPPQPLAGETIRLGCLAPDPGESPIGQSMWRSMQLAADDLNENGVPGIGGRGILGAKVEPVPGNTEASPETGREEFLRLVEEEHCEATVGTSRTRVTLECFEPMRDTETVHLTTGAAGPKPARIVGDRYEEFRWHFRVGPLDTLDLAAATLELLELYADILGWDTVALLVADAAPLDPFAARLDRNVRDTVDAVPVFERPAPDTADWTPVYDDIEASGADVTLLVQPRGGVAAIEQWADQERPFELGGLAVPAQDPDLWEAVSGACRYFFTMNAVTPRTANTPRTQAYLQRYRDRWDGAPVYTGPITYDAVRLYATAMARYVRENGLEDVPTSAEMVDALEGVRFERGTVLPEYRFTPPEANLAHDVAWTSMRETGVPVWQQWQVDEEIAEDDGVMHSFAPEQNKTSLYSYPHWIDYPDDHPANTEGPPGRDRTTDDG